MQPIFKVSDPVTSDQVSKRILFANVPADGHFNPLTGIAMFLKKEGYDVRWYASSSHQRKLKKLGIYHYPFLRALDVTGDNIEQIFPQRDKYKSQIGKLNFDMENFFIRRATEYYEDMLRIREIFPFDLVIADVAFSAVPLLSEHLGVPVISIGVFPLVETSKDLAPAGLGITPSNSFIGRKKQQFLRYLSDHILFRKPNQLMRKILSQFNISVGNSNVFDIIVRKSTLMLQSGTPGFEYERSDLGRNIRYIGPLLPYEQTTIQAPWYHEKLSRYEKVILVTQGTVEKDVNKLIVPTLEAFKGSEHLIVVTTGGSQTNELRKQFMHDNIIIEDFIPFSEIMPYVHLYITNGGYGGVMLGIKNQLPMVVAGVHEGKNEITARIGYFDLGINLKTEKPSVKQIRNAVNKILTDTKYKENVMRLAEEFEAYEPYTLVGKYVEQLLSLSKRRSFIKLHRLRA